MKVLHVISKLGVNCGGPARALATLARAQAEAGDEAVVLGCRPTYSPATIDIGRYPRLTVLPPVTESKMLWYDRKARAGIIAAAGGCDVIHVYGNWRYYLLASAAAAKVHNIPFIVRPCGNLGIETRRFRWWKKKPYFTLIERRVINRAAAVHCASEKEAEELDGLGITARLFIVPSPVDDGLLNLPPDVEGMRRACPGLRADRRTILYLGRICYVKQVDVLLEAFIRLAAEFPDWQLVLAGTLEDAQLVERLRRRIQEAALEARIFLPDEVDGAIKAALYASADVYAQASFHENFCMSIAEAMMFGRPIVASDGIALARDVEKAGAGLVCASEAGAFADALRTLMGDDARRDACGANARRAAERFRPRGVVEQLRIEYQRCIGRSEPSHTSGGLAAARS